MAKFSIDRFPAGFFDLTQDIARKLPIEVIEQWTHGDRTKESALRLLSTYSTFGSVVSTDSAGLTSLTRARGLIEILALVNHPKEILHGCGTAVGGEAIGVWAADNTQMFYPMTVTPAALLAMLIEAMARIALECEVKIGVCVHGGCFFRLGGGLYGANADRVEHLAEECTMGGEVIVTDEFHESLGPRHPFEFEERRDLRGACGTVWRVTGGPRAEELKRGSYRYPYPYSKDFYDDLRALDATPEPARLRAMHQKYMQKRTVVLVEREKEVPDEPEIAVLNDLAMSAAMTKVAARLLRETGGTEIKTAGAVGIYTFPDCRPGLDFARKMRGLFQEQNVAVRIGIDTGDVLVFDLDEGLVDIAGMPVNLASKIAQDNGQFGKIYLTEAAAAAVDATAFEKRKFTIAGLDVNALSD